MPARNGMRTHVDCSGQIVERRYLSRTREQQGNGSSHRDCGNDASLCCIAQDLTQDSVYNTMAPNKPPQRTVSCAHTAVVIAIPILTRAVQQLTRKAGCTHKHYHFEVLRRTSVLLHTFEASLSPPFLSTYACCDPPIVRPFSCVFFFVRRERRSCIGGKMDATIW